MATRAGGKGKTGGRKQDRNQDRAGSRIATGARPDAIFDTPLVLAYRAFQDPAFNFALGWLGGGGRLGITAATALGVLTRSADEDDRNKRRGFLANVVVFPITLEIFQDVELLLWSVPLPTRLTADDALVAAVALREKLPVYSLNPDRYSSVPGLTALPAR